MSGPLLYRLLVCGSRAFADRPVVWRALQAAVVDTYPPGVYVSKDAMSALTLVHGAATGADTIAAEIAKGWGMQVEPWRADWARYGAKAGPRRNREMIEDGADLVVAFFDASPCVGTRDCVRQAKRSGLRVVEHHARPAVPDEEELRLDGGGSWVDHEGAVPR